MTCARCGHSNPQGSRFCSSCGSALGPEGSRADETTSMVPVRGPEASDVDIAVHTEDVPKGQGMLIVKRGPNAGSRFVLEGDAVSAGRSPDADIFLDDVTVSRRHAQFVPSSGGYEVRDVGSLNGTYLNRERIDAATMTNGDEVQIGKFKLVYLTGRSPG